jgi:hypothetical protein
MGTYVPLSGVRPVGDPVAVIHGVIVHLDNDLPVLVDLEELPGPTDSMVRCTNVRHVDGKRPAFVHDKQSTFLLPMKIVRLIEVPKLSSTSGIATQDDDDLRTKAQEHEPEPELDDVDEQADEQADQDLLARIRSI